MKKLFLLLHFTMGVCYVAFSQNVGIGTTTPHSSALLDVSSTNKGVVLPRMSSTQRDAIASPVKGMLVYDTVHSNYFYHDGGRWLPLYQRNYDSAIVDYTSSASNVTYLPTSTTGSNTTISGSINSGFIYDNGGEAGNYSANSNSSVSISRDDTTIYIKIDVEEMDAELFYDSLFIISPGVDTIGLNGNETGSYIINTDVKILFKANNIQQFAGFKIRWAKVKVNTALQLPASPYGWHFEIKKLAAMGGLPEQNNWHTDSVGYGSFSYGIGVKTKGSYSVAFGRSSKATGNYGTVAIGWLTIASGNFGAVAIGDQSKATGTSGATAFGQETIASGNNGATAMGYYSVASGNNGAIAMGDHTIASGRSSTAMGFETKSKSFAGTVIGTYNDSTNAPSSSGINTANRIFQIGNGTSNSARSNAMTVLQSGNIGIGTVSPSQMLSVAAGMNIDQDDDNNGTTTNTLRFGASSSTAIGSNRNAGANQFGLDFYTNTLKRMSITNSGNVGINIINPSAKLEIRGALGFSSTTKRWEMNYDSTNNYFYIDEFGASKRFYIKNGGNVGIGNPAPLQRLDVMGNACFNDNTILLRAGSDMSQGLKYLNTVDGPYLFGYIGGALGTIDLPHSLTWHYSGAVGIKAGLAVGDGLVIDTANDNNGDLTNVLKFGSSSGEAIGSKRTAGGNQYGMDFYTSSAKRISITNGGNVGINVSNPSAKLEIRGALGFSSTTKRWEMNYDSTNNYFYIDEVGASRRFYIENGGNVGIGNSNPNTPLQFANTSGNKIAFFENGSNYYGIGTQTSLLQLYTPTSSDDIVFGYGNSSSFTENIRMDGSGSLAVKTDLTVQNGKGIIRNNSGVQLKQVVTSILVNTTIGGLATHAQAVTWAETFSGTPVAAYVGNSSGAGGWAEVVVTVGGVSSTGCTLYVFNPRNITVNPNFTINIITIGAQ